VVLKGTKLILEFLWRGFGREKYRSLYKSFELECMCVCRVFPSIALQMTVEFSNDRISGHCSNIYISPIMLGCGLHRTSFPSSSEQLRTDCFVIRYFFLLTTEFPFIWMQINSCNSGNM
jgi:hypothetical protein